MLSTYYLTLIMMTICQVLMLGIAIMFFVAKWTPLGVLLAIMIVLTMPIHTRWNDTYEKYSFVQNHKPTCQVENEDCLEQRLQWLQDSAYTAQELKSTQTSTNLRLDSLKTEISKYGH
jgi:sensor histidine kinase YesM